MSNYLTLITKDRLDSIVEYIKKSPSEGLIVCLGVYKGGDVKYIADHFPDREVIGIDTFQGLPKEDWNESEIHQPGDFSDTSYEAVKEYLKDNLNVRLVQGLFPDSAKNFEMESLLVGNKVNKYSFIHVDFDFYEGAKNAIKFYWPKLLNGGVMMFDDFDWPHTPGVKIAIEESGHKIHLTNAKYQAYIMKPLK